MILSRDEIMKAYGLNFHERSVLLNNGTGTTVLEKLVFAIALEVLRMKVNE
jgi:hypothetical protein